MDLQLLADILPQVVIDGLTLGFMYALIALGYTMVYGVLEFINFAHSEIFIVGAFAGVEILLSLKSLGVLESLPWPLILVLLLVAWRTRTEHRGPTRHHPRSEGVLAEFSQRDRLALEGRGNVASGSHQDRNLFLVVCFAAFADHPPSIAVITDIFDSGAEDFKLN